MVKGAVIQPREIQLTGILEAKPLPATKEEAVSFLQEKITKRRNQFIEEYRKGVHGTTLLTYEPALDREIYKELRQHRLVHIDAYQEVNKGLNEYTRFQVETFIGERLNVGLSKFGYDIRFSDGRGTLYGQGMDEPLLEMIERGRDSRGFVSTEIDKPRQEAEVVQFQKIQDIMGNPTTRHGTTIVSFSPPGKEGSAYAHNFYDVFILREKDTGERYVEARRYASGLSLEESLQKADILQQGYRTQQQLQEQVDSFFISHPIVLDNTSEFFANPDGIHQFLQGNPQAMSYEAFKKKVTHDPLFSEMVGEYLWTLQENPEDERLLNRILNAVMNRADELAQLRPPLAQTRREGVIHDVRSVPLPVMDHINRYGQQEVRKATTGCGSSGSFGQENGGYGSSRMAGNTSAFKGSEVASGEDTYGSRTFECPDCHETNTRPYNQLLSECQHCHSKKVAC